MCKPYGLNNNKLSLKCDTTLLCVLNPKAIICIRHNKPIIDVSYVTAQIREGLYCEYVTFHITFPHKKYGYTDIFVQFINTKMM